MSIASSYARALEELVAQNPAKGQSYIKNLRIGLAKRGHSKLLPRILSEYQKLSIEQERSIQHRAVTPEKERVRVLLGLYKKLIDAK